MRRHLRNFLRDTGGATAIIFGLTLIPIIAFAGFALDYGDSYRVRNNMQAATDAAALAAASLENASDRERITQAKDSFAANFSNSRKTSGVVPHVTVGKDEVVVTAKGNVSTILLGVLNISRIKVGVKSIAKLGEKFIPCFIALSPSDAEAVFVDDDAEIRTKECGAAVNSTASSAVMMDGDSEWRAQMVNVAGNYVESGGDIEASVGVYPNADSETDPYQQVDIPPFGGCSGGKNLVVTSDTTLNPGVYCGGLTIRDNARVTLNAGEYIIDRGDLFMEKISRMEGDGVVVFLTSSGPPSTIGSLRVTDHSQIRITAPTAGTYAGIAIYQDRDAPATGKNQILGVSSATGPAPEIHTEGSVYLPSQPLQMKGDALLRVRESDLCGKIVGYTFELQHDSRVRNDCRTPASSGPTSVRLIH